MQLVVVVGAAAERGRGFCRDRSLLGRAGWRFWHALVMSDRVSITVDNGIADVRLNRPDKLNALDQAMFQGIVDAGEGLKGDPGVRVVVLSGEGRGFCAGLDFGSFQAMAGGPPPPAAEPPDGGGLGAIGDTGGRITHLGQQAAGSGRSSPCR